MNDCFDKTLCIQCRSFLCSCQGKTRSYALNDSKCDMQYVKEVWENSKNSIRNINPNA